MLLDLLLLGTVLSLPLVTTLTILLLDGFGWRDVLALLWPYVIMTALVVSLLSVVQLTM